MKVERQELILAIYPNARGFAFVVFEGPDAVVDWGISELRRSNRYERCFQLVELLLKKYGPDAFVLRAMPDGKSAVLGRRLADLAKHREIPAILISRKEVRLAFSSFGRATRHAIVSEIARRLPMFSSFQPGRRKIWNGEDRRMGLFDAAALAITFFIDQSYLHRGSRHKQIGLHTDLQT